jgi:EAL domain-containing protein (putative c-di-GMP-specific phosphodiesterase class I)
LSDDAGRLWLAPPLEHSRVKLLTALREAACRHHCDEHGHVVIDIGSTELQPVLNRLDDWLSATETQHTKALFLASEQTPDLSLLAEVEPLARWIGLARGQWLADILECQRLSAHFQPIVVASDPGHAYAHECLLRGFDEQGQMVSPDALFAAARSAAMLFHLDRAARLTAIDEAARLQLDTPIFINFTPTAIYDPAFCLRTTIAAAHRTGWMPERFVFEVVETEEVADSRDLVGILAEYRAAGFRVALDDLGAGYGSLTLLERLRPDIVKFDRDLITEIDHSASRQAIVTALVRMAHDLGIATVGEGVETRAEWEWLREAGVDYLQGFLFARPANPPTAPGLPL